MRLLRSMHETCLYNENRRLNIESRLYYFDFVILVGIWCLAYGIKMCVYDQTRQIYASAVCVNRCQALLFTYIAAGSS